MKVAHVTTVPMSLLFLRGQAEEMRRRGVELIAISAPGEELEAFGAEEGVPVYAVRMERRITPLRDLGALAQLARCFRRVRPDVVHAHTPKGGLLGTLAARLAGVSVRIYHMRGLPLEGARGPKRLLLTLTERVSCAAATHVICVGPSLRDLAVELRLVSAEKALVLGPGSGQGVDTDHFDPGRLGREVRARTRAELGLAADDLVYGFVGRIVRDKGIHELAEAWATVRRQNPAARLLLVGPFEPQDPIDARVEARLRSDDRVRFVGSSRDVAALYAAMDVVVLPTYREGFPNVPLEAAAMELPVVAARATGCADAVADGETGTLVPVGDAAALARAMGAYFDDALRRSHGAAGRARVLRDFQRADVLSRIGDLYLQVRPAPRRPFGSAARVAP